MLQQFCYIQISGTGSEKKTMTRDQMKDIKDTVINSTHTPSADILKKHDFFKEFILKACVHYLLFFHQMQMIAL